MSNEELINIIDHILNFKSCNFSTIEKQALGEVIGIISGVNSCVGCRNEGKCEDGHSFPCTSCRRRFYDHYKAKDHDELKLRDEKNKMEYAYKVATNTIENWADWKETLTFVIMCQE